MAESQELENNTEHIIHNAYDENIKSRWTNIEVDDSTVVSIYNEDGSKMDQYIDVDGNLIEEFS